MMIAERQVLKLGTSLSLDGKKCMILGVMGTGTSCIAYKAQMKLTIKGQTALRTIVLKELYPAHQNIIRGTDNSLIIPGSSKSMFEEESESFVKAAILQFEFHNEEDLTNFTSDIEVVYELNNTLYSVTGIVSGKSYDKINPENITSILKVGESLSHAISYYHERDYLNLDIKPSNIFYENLPGDNVAIKLFDFNTVCTKEEASQGKFSYSDGYAAPEVKAAKKGSGKLSEVGEQADIYSIGAVIFEKIMGRIPKVADQRAGKRWKLESNLYLKDAVPQFQKGITELFRKTLAIDKKDRYSSVTDLLIDLQKLVELSRIKVYLQNQNIKPSSLQSDISIRKEQFNNLSICLDTYHVAYLDGVRGASTKEASKEYAEYFGNAYIIKQSVKYNESLKNTISALKFVNLDDSLYRYEDLFVVKMNLLSDEMLYKHTLIIIYDYNFLNSDDDSLVIEQLKKLPIHVLLSVKDYSFDEQLNTKINSIHDLLDSKENNPNITDRVSKIKSHKFMTTLTAAIEKDKEWSEFTNTTNSYFDKNISLFGETEYLQNGKHFRLPEIDGFKTLVFQIKDRINYQTLSKIHTCEILEYIEEKNEDSQIVKTILVDNPTGYDQLILLHFHLEKNLVFVNMALLEDDRVRMSTKPQYLEFTNHCMRLDVDSAEFNEEFEFNEDESTCKWFYTFIDDVQSIIVDPETVTPVERELYYNDDTKQIEAQIKLQPNKNYFCFSVSNEDNNLTQEPLTDFEIAELYRDGTHGFPKDIMKAAEYFEKDSSPQALYEIAVLFKTEPDIFDKDTYFEYLKMSSQKDYEPALLELGFNLCNSENPEDVLTGQKVLTDLSEENGMADFFIGFFIETNVLPGGLEQAFKYYFRAFQKKHKAAGARLEKDVSTDDKIHEILMFQNFMDNIDHGHSIAEYCMGCILYFGIDISVDKDRGLYWLHKSADHKNEMAVKELSDINYSPIDE